MAKPDLLVVSGASRGIGQSVMQACLADSIKTVAISSSPTTLAPELAQHAAYLITLTHDLGDYNGLAAKLTPAISALLNSQRSAPARIGIVLCASQIGEHGGLMSADFAAWDRLFQINVLGNLAIIKTVLSLVKPDDIIRIVFFAGGGAAYAYPEFSGYALTKVATVRTVENLGAEFKTDNRNASIVALAPGAVDTNMLKTVVAHGGTVKTKTDISEPTGFAKRFVCDEMPSLALNGRFVHVRDDVTTLAAKGLSDTHFKLRRVE